MKKLSLIPKFAFAAVLMAGALTASAAPVQLPPRSCAGLTFCPDDYVPVICSNGAVYSNQCYASRACATGCTPYGISSI
jgi:hypothetical protein